MVRSPCSTSQNQHAVTSLVFLEGSTGVPEEDWHETAGDPHVEAVVADASPVDDASPDRVANPLFPEGGTRAIEEAWLVTPGHPHVEAVVASASPVDDASSDNVLGEQVQLCQSLHSEGSASRESGVCSFASSNIARQRSVCSEGLKCRSRKASHIAEYSHPFDMDYLTACERAGCDPEEPSLRSLFDWVDSDSSGKISWQELQESIPTLSELLGENLLNADAAWEKLDNDGNETVSFGKFAGWAGPRLGLPLGVKHLLRRETSVHVDACGIIGCPCEGFVPRHTRNFGARFWTKKYCISSTQAADERLAVCRCGHTHGAHSNASRVSCQHEIPYPKYWSIHTAEDFVHMHSVNAQSLEQFQHLFDTTFCNIYTRDRRRHNPCNPNVPRGYTVVSAVRCENSRLWREYYFRRAQLLEDGRRLDPSDFHMYTEVKSTEAWKGTGGKAANRLRPECNEWYLFHGTNAKNALSICHNSFKLSLAGDCTGTLYGRGAYFAESITKADEYAKPNERGEYTVLLCRVLGGRVMYTDEENPDPEELRHSCIQGPYNCILGDREKCRNTFREFVFYDSENLYAEYIIHYKRR